MSDVPKKSHHKPKDYTVLKTGNKIDEPPDYLGLVGKMCYKKVVADLEAMGIADGADSRAVEAFASAYEEYRKARKVVLDEGFTYIEMNIKGDEKTIKRAEVEVMANAWTRMRSLLGDLYLTPATRTKAPGGGEKVAEDPFSEFMPK